MAHTIVRSFFDKDGNHRRTVFCEDDNQLINHIPADDEIYKDIPHDVFKSRFITININSLEQYHRDGA